MEQNKSLSTPITLESLHFSTRNLFNVSTPKNEASVIAAATNESSVNELSSATHSDKSDEVGLLLPQDTQTCSTRLPGDDQQMATFDEVALDDSSVIEFSHLQLKLKSPVRSPATRRQYAKEVVLDPRLLSRPRIEFADIALRGSSPLIRTLPKQDASEPHTLHSASPIQQLSSTESSAPTDWTFQPVVLPESSVQPPVTFEPQELYQPEMLHCQHKAGAHTFDPFNHREDSSYKQSPKTLATSFGQTMLEPAHPLDCCSDHEPFSHVFMETAPPPDEFLRPNVTAITLEAGPSIRRPTKSSFENTTLKFPWSIPQKSPQYTCLTASTVSPFPPPPPYSECTQQSPFKDQKLAHEERFSSSRPQPHISVIPMRDRQDEDPYRLFSPSYGPKVGGMNALDAIGYNNFFHPARVGTRTQPVRSQFETAADLRPSRPPKSDHQALAFVSCLFCWPIGLVAIYYSNMCHILKSEGEYERAHIYSRLAFIASMAGLGSGIIAYIIMFVYEKAVYL